MNLQGSTDTIENLLIHLESKSEITLNSTVEDNELKATIINNLKWFSRIPLEHTTITVKNGYLTLEGSVAWAYQRIVTFQMLRNIKGLKGIENNISIVPYIITLGKAS
jgi:osmotically-inducible protein OsmY